MQIPADLESMTPEWLTQVLTAAGAIEHTSVTAIESERLGKGRGLVGQVIRFRLTYHSPEVVGAPESIVAKISHSDPDLRKQLSDLYKKEVNFYKEVADEIDIRVPHLYYGALDEESGIHVLLLEDLRNGRIGDIPSGCSREDAELVIDYLVRLHVAWWEHPRLESMDWVPAQSPLDDPEVKEEWDRGMNDCWCQFEEKFGGRIPAPIEKVWPVLVQHRDKIRTDSSVPPLTLCHGDFHLGNLFFCDVEAEFPLAVFDWQAIIRAQGAFDLSYFIIGNLEPELRRKVEKDLLQKYCAKLNENGIEDYNLDQCYYSYRITLYEVILPQLVGIAASFDLSDELEQTVLPVLFRRASEAIIDHPIGDLVHG